MRARVVATAGGPTKARDNGGSFFVPFRLRPGVDKVGEKCKGNNFFSYLFVCIYICKCYFFKNIFCRRGP